MIAPTQECNWNCEAEDFEGHPEKIPLGGPNRTEAEHPQPGFGQVGFTNSSRMQGPLHLAWTIHLHFCLRENDRINEAANATVDTAIAKMSKDMTLDSSIPKPAASCLQA